MPTSETNAEATRGPSAALWQWMPSRSSDIPGGLQRHRLPCIPPAGCAVWWRRMPLLLKFVASLANEELAVDRCALGSLPTVTTTQSPYSLSL